MNKIFIPMIYIRNKISGHSLRNNVILILAPWLFLINSCEIKRQANEVQTPIADKIGIINKQLVYAQVRSVRELAIGENNKNQLYKIELRPEYLQYADTFKAYEYFKGRSGVEHFPIGALCNLVDSLRQNRERKVKDILKQTEFGFDVGPDIAKVNIEHMQNAFAELWVPTLDLGKDYKIDIYVRGFADGFKREWSRPFPTVGRDTAYHFKTVSYLPTTDIGANPSTYSLDTVGFSFEPDSFRNKDLPNLRAKFYKDDLINKLVHNCQLTQVQHVYILEGYEFDKDDYNPNERTVEVYIREVVDESPPESEGIFTRFINVVKKIFS